MNPDRRTALLTGVLFIVTFVTAIPAVFLYAPALNDTQYVLGAGADTRVFLGAFLELLLILANLGTALALFSILKRQSERLSLTYVPIRGLECAFILVGIVATLSIVTLRQDVPNADPDSLVVAARSLVAVHDWTFLLGPGVVAGIGNGLVLGWLMYQSGLVPRRMAFLGLIGGPLLCASGIAILFGAFDAGSPPQAIATVPEFLWEAFLGIYLATKGFKPSSPILHTRANGAPLRPSPRPVARQGG